MKRKDTAKKQELIKSIKRLQQHWNEKLCPRANELEMPLYTWVLFPMWFDEKKMEVGFHSVDFSLKVNTKTLAFLEAVVYQVGYLLNLAHHHREQKLRAYQRIKELTKTA